jgi:hypothetical protein
MGSAKTRPQSFWAGIEMFSQEPLTGVGIGNTAVYRRAFIDGVYLAPHNFYAEVLGETGLIGAVAFLFVIAALFLNIRRTRLLERHISHPTITVLADLAKSCRHVIVLLLISGLAGDGLLRFQWLWLAGFALLTRNFSESIAGDQMESPHPDDNCEL